MIIRGDQHVDDWAEAAVDYLDGRLDQETRAAVEAHLSCCADCTARLRGQQYVVSFLQDTVLDDPPEDLEYRSIGEIIFPSPGTEPMIAAPMEKSVYRTPRWFRELRHWVPAAVAIVALASAVAAYSVVKSGSGSMTATTTTAGAFAASATTAAPAASDATESLAAAGSAAPSTTAAASAVTSTTVAAAYTTTNKAPVPVTTQDPKDMIRALQTAQAPTFVAFQAVDATRNSVVEATSAPDDTTPTTMIASTDTTVGGSTTTATITGVTDLAPVTAARASDLLQQIKEFTGLEPVDKSLWLGGPTFAVYLPRKDAAKLVDLVRSISSSMGLTVSVGDGPPAASPADCTRLLAAKSTFPVLQAHRALQPSTWGYDFTTSTLTSSGGGTNGTSATLPNAVDHVLVVICIPE